MFDELWSLMLYVAGVLELELLQRGRYLFLKVLTELYRYESRFLVTFMEIITFSLNRYSYYYISENWEQRFKQNWI